MESTEIELSYTIRLGPTVDRIASEIYPKARDHRQVDSDFWFIVLDSPVPIAIAEFRTAKLIRYALFDDEQISMLLSCFANGIALCCDASETIRTAIGRTPRQCWAIQIFAYENSGCQQDDESRLREVEWRSEDDTDFARLVDQCIDWSEREIVFIARGGFGPVRGI